MELTVVPYYFVINTDYFEEGDQDNGKVTSDKPIEEYVIEDVTFSTLKNKNKRIKLAIENIDKNYLEADSVINGNGLLIEEISIKTKNALTIKTPGSCRNESIFKSYV